MSSAATLALRRLGAALGLLAGPYTRGAVRAFATEKEIAGRIAATKNIQKITSSIKKMVSAAKRRLDEMRLNPCALICVFRSDRCLCGSLLRHAEGDVPRAERTQGSARTPLRLKDLTESASRRPPEHRSRFGVVGEHPRIVRDHVRDAVG